MNKTNLITLGKVSADTHGNNLGISMEGRLGAWYIRHEGIPKK